jgi:hypothetical protein
MLVMKPILTNVTLHHKIASRLTMSLLTVTVNIKKSIAIFVTCILIVFYTLFFRLASFICKLLLFNLTRSWQPDVPTITAEI